MTPGLVRMESLINEESSSDIRCNSPTPLLRKKLKLGQYSSVCEQLDEDSDCESEHSLCDDVYEDDYFFKIRQLMKQCPH